MNKIILLKIKINTTATTSEFNCNSTFNLFKIKNPIAYLENYYIDQQIVMQIMSRQSLIIISGNHLCVHLFISLTNYFRQRYSQHVIKQKWVNNIAQTRFRLTNLLPQLLQLYACCSVLFTLRLQLTRFNF